MKLASIFDVVTDAQDILDLFDGIDNVDQLRGRLRRVGQLEAEDFLACLQGLQASIAKALNDTIEMNPDLGDPDDELTVDEPLLPEEQNLEDLADKSPPEEDQNPEPPTQTEK